MLEFFIAFAASAQTAAADSLPTSPAWIQMVGTFILGLLATLIWQPKMTPSICASFRSSIQSAIEANSKAIAHHETRLTTQDKEIATLTGNIMPLLRVIEEKTSRLAFIEADGRETRQRLETMCTASAVMQAKMDAMAEQLRSVEGRLTEVENA